MTGAVRACPKFWWDPSLVGSGGRTALMMADFAMGVVCLLCLFVSCLVNTSIYTVSGSSVPPFSGIIMIKLILVK